VIRNTTQNAAIRQAFAQAGRPLTPPEVLAAAQRHSAKVGIATVYRAIKRLAKTGELVLADTVGAETTGRSARVTSFDTGAPAGRRNRPQVRVRL
jgi:Fe2+ or Zn2+ uptake regulation protein